MSPRLLRPRSTLHPEAAAWAARVVANGGSVSGSTLSAVSKFCAAIASAGIRDRFLRLNLFCGSFQGAFVPLYRSASFGGTPLGNATDTNLGSPAFLVGDYSETGVNAGLNGNGTSKYLDTGLNLSDLPSIATGHLSILKGAGSTFGVVPIGVRNAASDQYFRYDQTGPAGNNRGLWGNVIIANAASNTSRLYAIVSRTSSTSLTVYHDGVSAGTSSTAATPALPSRNLFVFAENNGSAGSWWPHALQAYSVGLSLDAGQALALSNAMATFQSSLVRS
jgi:hypothetical protein